jgi:primosomal replication protein N
VRGANQLTLDATLTQASALRYTPAGIAVLECALHHQSTQPEAGNERKVDCEIAAIAFAATATALAAVAAGSALRVTGFVARRYRTGITLALHINEFEFCKGN